jgi:capsular exopolysaccharide synthesis family protein
MPDAASKEELATSPEGGLRRPLDIMRRRKVVFLAALITVPLVALLVSLSQENQYTATATLLFQGSHVNADAAAREAATNSELVGLPVVAEQTARELGGRVTDDEVLGSISVDAGSTIADIGKISATTNSPELSARMANAYTRAYIKFRREADRSQVQQAIGVVKRSLAALSPAELAAERGQGLQDRLARLKVQQALQTGKAVLVQPARPPSAPSSPKTRRNVVLGIILGAVLGFGLAALLERFDRRVRTVEELEELFGIPILARIPRSRKIGRASSREIGRAELGDVLQAPEAEAFRILRTNLRYFNVDRPLRSILVASPEVGDGKSTVARCLAAAMAEMGDNVVLVEADLRKGGDFHDVNGQPAAGVSNILGSPLEFEVVARVEVQAAGSGQPRALSILPSGPVPPNPGELIESERMRTLIAELQERFAIVVIDSPPLGIVSDALALVPEVSGVLVVGGVGKTTRDGARNFTRQLSLLGTKALGITANFTVTERGGYYY